MALRSGCARSVCFLFAAVFLIFSAGAQPQVPVASIAAAGLPERLSDLEFWRLIEEFSEPNGYFTSDNLLSNEMWMQHVIPDLIRRTQPGGAYLGVGPEQNFTYIAALRPGIAFITDIRRGNLHTQLMYKALFELSAGRADFVARLFTRAVPEGLDGKSSVGEIIEKLIGVATGDEAAYKNNLQEITDLLVKKHRFPLSSEDQAGIDYVYRNFFRFGPGLNYRSSGQSLGGRGGNFATYADLMTLTDRSGVSRSYLASDENFKTVKDLEQNNLVIPIVGDFSGPKALRTIGNYLKQHNSTVSAFYLSNVEQYLGSWSNFCANVAGLPLDDKSTFIRASRDVSSSYGGFSGGLASSLGDMKAETMSCGGPK